MFGGMQVLHRIHCQVQNDVADSKARQGFLTRQHDSAGKGGRHQKHFATATKFVNVPQRGLLESCLRMHQLKVVAHTLNFRSLFVFRYSLFINIHSLRIAFAAFSHAFFSLRRSSFDESLYGSFVTLIAAGLPSEPSDNELQAILLYVSVTFFTVFILNIFIGESQPNKVTIICWQKKTIHLVCLPATFIHRNIIKIKTKIEF